MLRRGDTMSAMHGPDCFCNLKRGCFLHFFLFFEKHIRGAPCTPNRGAPGSAPRLSRYNCGAPGSAPRLGDSRSARPVAHPSAPQMMFTGAPRTGVFLVVL